MTRVYVMITLSAYELLILHISFAEYTSYSTYPAVSGSIEQMLEVFQIFPQLNKPYNYLQQKLVTDLLRCRLRLFVAAKLIPL